MSAPVQESLKPSRVESTKVNNDSVCFHCLEPVPKFSRIVAQVNGCLQPMCCYGCKAAAEFINGKDLADFYQHRKQSGGNRFFANVARPFSEKAINEWAYLDQLETAQDYVSLDQTGRRCLELFVDGLYCSSCSWLISKALKQLSNAIEVHIQLDAKRVSITIGQRNSSIKFSSVLEIISGLGYHVTPVNKRSAVDDIDQRRAIESRQSVKRILVAGLGMMQVMTYAIGLYLGEFQGMDDSQRQFLTLVSLLVATVVVFYSGKPFFINALNDLSNKHVGMDVPIAFAIAGAYFPSVYDTLFAHAENIYFDAAVMFIFFLLIGRYLEIRARHQLTSASDALVRLLPTRVEVQRKGTKIQSIKPQDVQLGDYTELSSGNVVPFDATVLTGEARVDESLLTGEVHAVLKGVGHTLLAGSKVMSGCLSIQASHIWDESSIVKIENLLNKKNDSLTNEGLGLQRFSQTFILAVLALTVLVGGAWWFYDASRVFEIVLAMLIASCPCAFALALPVASTAASNALRKHGVLLANPMALDILPRVTSWCFDKTGTLTKGQMVLQRVVTFSPISEAVCVEIAAAIEKNNGHALASAFSQIETTLTANDINESLGNGLSAFIDGQQYWLGKRDWVIKQSGIKLTSQFSFGYASYSEILLASDKHILALMFVSDELRSGVNNYLSFLKQSEKKASILSGDTTASVQSLATTLDVSQAFGALVPEQKMDLITSDQKKGEIIAMVGDGLNDAPVMAQANLSIALASGSQITQSQADVVLLNSRLDALIPLHEIARLSKRITTQNLTWALVYNALVLPLAACGYLSPWIAALGMSTSSLVVVLNALRIRTSNKRPL